jgi:hypothetical protein
VGHDSQNARAFTRECEAALAARDWPVGWLEELPALVEDLLVDEAAQYLSGRLSEYQLPVRIGGKTREALARLLLNFGLGQAYAILWSQAKSAAAEYQTGRYSLQHAANLVPGGIQRHVDRALSDGWTVKEYRRPTNLPLSWMSQVLFDSALHLGSRLYTLTLHQLHVLANQQLAPLQAVRTALLEAMEQPRHIGRPVIFDLLRHVEFDQPYLAPLAELTEELTMGLIHWEDYVSDARALVSALRIPRYL